jgi:hypothetical protein
VTQLTETLDALVDPCLDERGDWADVLQRATVTPTAAIPRRRIRVVVAVAALSLVILFATPAFGLRGALLDAIGRTDVPFVESKSAPPVVQREFEELSVGAPPGMDPRVIAGETRKVGTLPVGGRPRALWVAPTALGGFCYTLEHSGGGCLRNGGPSPPPVTLTGSYRQLRDRPTEMLLLGGKVLSDRIARITVEFREGEPIDIPFIYVSAPIDAGFFSYDVPAGHREEAAAPVAVVGRDADGDVVHREPLSWPRRLPFGERPKPQALPSRPAKPPSAPLQRGTADGLSVVAGRNGVVVFDATKLRPALASLLAQGRAAWGCFKLHGASDVRSLVVEGRFASRVALELTGIQTPFDGCEVRGSYGRAWPDRRGYHSAVEIPFTPAAERHFEDRAAARELALFVRSRRVQELRKEPGDALATALRSSYGDAVVRLPLRRALPPAGMVGYWTGPGGATFVRESSTGRRFEVETDTRGRIVRENVDALTRVF